MTGVLVRKGGETQSDTQRKEHQVKTQRENGHVTMYEIGATHLQAKKCQGLPETLEAKERYGTDFFLELSESIALPTP